MSNKSIGRILFVLFWSGLFVLISAIYYNQYPAQIALPKSALIILVFMLVFYTNSEWLVKRFFIGKKYGWYAASVLALMVSAVFLRTMIDFIFPNTQLPLQHFVSQNRPYAGPVIMMSFWIFLSFFYRLMVSRVEMEKKYRDELNTYMVAQNQFLKSQINPHFLFNNLNNIYSLIQTKSPHAGEMVLKLSELLRYSVYRAQEEKVSLNDELQQIMHLTDLYKLKEPYNLQMRFGNREEQQIMIEPMLLIPLVENCFKHGNTGHDADAFISIETHTGQNEFLFRTKNSYDPLDKHETGGVGLTNIRKRLSLVYGREASLVTTKKDRIFSAELKIKWKKN